MPRNLRIDGFIANRAFNRPLLLEIGKAHVIANYLEQRMFGNLPNQLMMEDDDVGHSEPRQLGIKHEGVAIIPVIGSLVHRGGYMDAMSGIMSYQCLREALIDAANDATVKTILLDIDSGGGEVEGNFELGRLIREINDEHKPVVAISNGSAYSGAFSLGVSAGNFYMTETGGVGSVGVIIQHVDYSKANEMRGIKVTQITAGERKGELSPDFPLPKEAKKMLQDEVNRTADIFIKHVAEMRDISENDVRSTEAALLFGEDAVNIGFVDGIISFDDLLSGLVQSNLPLEPIERNQRMNEMFSNLKKKGDAAPATAAEQKPDEEKEVATPAEEPEDEDAPEKDSAEPEDDEGEDKNEKAAQIVEACTAAGHPEMAAGYIRANASVQEVKDAMDVNNQIRKACTLAGKPDRAKGFISSGKSVQQVQDTLLAEMSSEQDDVSPKESPDAVKADLKETQNVILADVEKRKQAANKGAK